MYLSVVLQSLGVVHLDCVAPVVVNVSQTYCGAISHSQRKRLRQQRRALYVPKRGLGLTFGSRADQIRQHFL